MERGGGGGAPDRDLPSLLLPHSIIALSPNQHPLKLPQIFFTSKIEILVIGPLSKFLNKATPFEIQPRLTFTSHVVKSAIRDNEIIFIDFTNFTDMLHEKLAGIFYFVAFVDWIM